MFAVLILLVLAQACTETDDTPPVVEVSPSDVLVLNEGLFRRGNATISGYDAGASTTLGTVYDPSSNAAGGLDILQSATLLGDTIVLVANNSNALVLLQKDNLEEIDRFEALGSPRYLTRMRNGQLLVTDLYANSLLVLDSDFSVAQIIRHEGHAEASIPFQDGALFVSPGRKSIFYYNALLGEVVDSLVVPFRANAILGLDNDRIAVCGGILEQGEAGGLSIVNWGDKSVDLTLSFSESESSLYPRLAKSNNRLFCLQRDLLSLPLDDLIENRLELVSLLRFADPYGLGVDPINNDIYITDAKNGLSLGEVVRFDAAITAIDSFEVGVFPNGLIFR